MTKRRSLLGRPVFLDPTLPMLCLNAAGLVIGVDNLCTGNLANLQH